MERARAALGDESDAPAGLVVARTPAADAMEVEVDVVVEPEEVAVASAPPPLRAPRRRRCRRGRPPPTPPKRRPLTPRLRRTRPRWLAA